MTILVLDSDGLIKLAKAGVLEELVKYRKCIITQEVFNETVEKGKERLYEDAYIIEELINKKLLSVGRIKTTEVLSLGKGEASSLEICKKKNCSAIITDVRRFLKMLEEQNIPFIMPSDAIVSLLKKRIITRKKALEALEKIKPLIRKDIYEKAKSEVD